MIYFRFFLREILGRVYTNDLNKKKEQKKRKKKIDYIVHLYSKAELNYMKRKRGIQEKQ